MAQPNPIYNFLKENNLTQKSEQDFLREYNDRGNAENLYKFMSENKLTEKDFDSFYTEYLSPGELSGIPQGSQSISQTLEQPLSSSEGPSSATVLTGRENPKTYEEFLSVNNITDVDEQGNGVDYDYKGFFEDNGGVYLNEGEHLADTYKLPNHPTFSTASKYNTEKQQGGKWTEDENGKWTFEASEFNLEQQGRENLIKYFAETEPNANLVLPDGSLGYRGIAPTVQLDRTELNTQQLSDGTFITEIDVNGLGQSDIEQAIRGENTDPDFLQNLGNNIENVANRIKGTIPRANVTGISLAQKLYSEYLGFGDTLSDIATDQIYKETLAGWGDNPDDLETYRQQQIQILDYYDAQQLPTQDLVDNISEGKFQNVPSSVVTAMASLAATAIPAALTRGVTLFTDMVGDALIDYNKEKAKRLNISVDELYRTNQDEVEIPLLIGTVNGGLEKIGLKGAANIVNKRLSSAAFRKVTALIAGEANKEGLTEWLQTGTEEINNSLGRGEATTTALEKAWDRMASIDGVRAYVTGFVASAASGGLGRLAKNLTRTENKIKVTNLGNQAASIQSELNKTDINPNTRTVLEKEMASIKDDIANTVIEDYEQTINLTEQQQSEVGGLVSELENLQGVVNDPSVSEEVKNSLQPRIQELSTQIDEVINQDVQDNQAFTETEQQELVNSGAVTNENPVAPVEIEEEIDVPLTEDDRSSVIDSLRTEEGRAARADAALNRMKQYIAESRVARITPESGRERATKDIQFFKDAVEYASIKLLDGTIKTYEQFRQLVDLPNSKELRDAFRFARTKVVNPQKYSIWNTVDTFNKGFVQGVRQGVETERERGTQRERERVARIRTTQQQQKDNLNAAKKELADKLKAARDAGTFRGFVRGSTVANVIKSVNNATTENQVYKAMDRLQSAIENINYDKNVEAISKIQRSLRRRASAANTPANQVEVTRSLSQIRPSSLAATDLEAIINGLNEFTSIRSVESGENLLGIMNASRDQKTIERIKARLARAQVDQNIIDNITTVEQALNAVETYFPTTEGEESTEPTAREKRENRIEAAQDILRGREEDKAFYQEALDAITNIDISQLTDEQLRVLDEVVTNTLANNNYFNAGQIITAYKIQQRFGDSEAVERVRNSTRSVKGWIDWILSRAANVRTQFEAIVNRSSAWPELANMVGFIDINESTERFHRRYRENIESPLKSLFEKYRSDLNDPLQSALGAMYADLSQYRRSWSDEQVTAEFEGRKEAIKESIERYKKRSENDLKFREQNSDLIKNLEVAYGMISSAQNAAEIRDMLNTGQKALFDFKVQAFRDVFEDFRDNAAIFNNTLVEEDWENYTPRAYRATEFIADRRNQAQAEMLDAVENSAAFQGGVTTSETSGASNQRILSGNELPIGKAIWFDSIDNFITEYKKAIYDIETQGARKYTSNVLRGRRQLREGEDPNTDRSYAMQLVSDKSSADALVRGISQKVTNDKNLLYPPRQLEGWRRISNSLERLAAFQALGGAFQAFKQGAPALMAAAGRLGRNVDLLGAATKEYLSNYEQVMKIFENSAISRRAIEQVVIPQQSLTTAQRNRLRSELKNTGSRYADQVIKAIDNIALGSMRLGDRSSIRIAGFAFYMEYLRKNGISFNINEHANNPNKLALEYANQQTDVALNISDPSLRPTFRFPVYIAPYSSFSMNEKANALVNTAKLLDSESSANTKAIAAQNLGTHILTLIGYQGISWGIRYASLSASVGLMTYLLSKGDLDDDDKKEAQEELDRLREDLIDRNNKNSIEYGLKDLAYGGLGGDLTEPLWVQLRNTVGSAIGVDDYKPYQGGEVDRAFGSLGGLGIPFARAYTAYNNLDKLSRTDEEYRITKYGIENAQGTDFYVPVDYSNVRVPDFSKQIYGLASMANIIGMTGTSWQEVTALTSRATSLARQLENKLDGKDRKVSQADLKRLESLKKIDVEGDDVELSDEQYDFLLKARAKFLGDNYDTIKVAVGSAYGDEKSERRLANIADNYAKSLTKIEFDLITGKGAVDRIKKQEESARLYREHVKQAQDIGNGR